MVLYLQANYNGTFAIAEKNKYKDEVAPYDYYTLEDNIPSDTPVVEINKLVVEKYGCKKLVIQF